MSEEVKKRVIARVTGQEYTPTTTVEITEDQEVVAKRPLFEQQVGRGTRLVDVVDDKLLINLRPATPEEIDAQRVSAYEHGAMRGPRQAIAEPIAEKFPEGVVEFTQDVVATLETELESVLNPDTRVLVNHDEAFDGLDSFYKSIEPEGATLLPKLKANLAKGIISVNEARAAIGLSPIWPTEVVDVTNPDKPAIKMNVAAMVERFKQLNPPQEEKPQVVQAPALSDYEQAAELNISVHAYRHFYAAIRRIETRADAILQRVRDLECSNCEPAMRPSL